jgi:hypothetical protein
MVAKFCCISNVLGDGPEGWLVPSVSFRRGLVAGFAQGRLVFAGQHAFRISIGMKLV